MCSTAEYSAKVVIGKVLLIIKSAKALLDRIRPNCYSRAAEFRSMVIIISWLTFNLTEQEPTGAGQTLQCTIKGTRFSHTGGIRERGRAETAASGGASAPGIFVGRQQ
jgi:hypothetical protein